MPWGGGVSKTKPRSTTNHRGIPSPNHRGLDGHCQQCIQRRAGWGADGKHQGRPADLKLGQTSRIYFVFTKHFYIF